MMLMMLTALVASAKDIKTVMFTTNPQMQSADCGNKIKSRLQLENGVELIKTDLKEQKVMVKYDAEKTTPCKIVAAFSKLGYTARPVARPQSGCCKEGKPNCCKAQQGACKAKQNICKVELNACAAKNAGCSADKECKQACPKEAKECPNAGKECPKAKAGCAAKKQGGCCNGK